MKIRKTISLDFDGFYPEGVTLPDYSGLYFVYKGTPAEKVSATLMNCYTLGKRKTFVIVLALIMNIMKIGSKS